MFGFFRGLQNSIKYVIMVVHICRKGVIWKNATKDRPGSPVRDYFFRDVLQHFYKKLSCRSHECHKMAKNGRVGGRVKRRNWRP